RKFRTLYLPNFMGEYQRKLISVGYYVWTSKALRANRTTNPFMGFFSEEISLCASTYPAMAG
ncbi:MAG: hypothetical protein U9R24_02890, partial [Thermodesulfobacteriota bacterium]|nr:hypothetical protein [Thermodesulfobacteriota bacterium]